MIQTKSIRFVRDFNQISPQGEIKIVQHDYLSKFDLKGKRRSKHKLLIVYSKFCLSRRESLSISIFDYPSGEQYWSIVYIEDIVYFTWSNESCYFNQILLSLDIYLQLTSFLINFTVSMTNLVLSFHLHQLVSNS